MGTIRVLPPGVINQIAAGEVVERPASVVKELLENAIDAGATRIELAVERGGKDLVRVADNGRGMDREDLPLAFLPHATSKLGEAADLSRIATLGFRGEALAAVAEIAKVRCQTRMGDAGVGSEITIDAGKAGDVRDCGCPAGTVIEVRNLFFNTPVRRTFLKSDATEASHVVEMFVRIALAHPTVHLTYRSGGRIVHDLPAVTGLKERIGVFCGRELAENLFWVESQVDRIHLWGYVAHPSQSRSSPKGQYVFVGGRYVRDRALGHALSEAYRGLLMVGRMPVAFLHLEIPPEEVDVNVHPTKIEVRFRDSHRVYSQLLSTVRQTFLGTDLHTQLQTPVLAAEQKPSATVQPAFALGEGSDERQAVASWFSGGSGGGGFKPYPAAGYGGRSASPAWGQSLPPVAGTAGPAERFDELEEPLNGHNELPESPEPRAGLGPFSAVPEPSGSPVVPVAAGGTVPEPAPRPPGRPRAIQLHDSYLVVESPDGIVVIDQHALHERILYEELRERVEQGGVEAQRLLVPEPVQLTAEEAADVLERREALRKLGLEIEPFGGDTVLVGSLPAMLAGAQPEQLVRDLADHLRALPVAPTPDAMLEDVLNMVACKAAVKAGQRLSPEEIEALLERKHLVLNTHHCPHGRPTALVFTKAELERQFGRI